MESDIKWFEARKLVAIELRQEAILLIIRFKIRINTDFFDSGSITGRRKYID